MAVKIKSYKVSKSGRGKIISLPLVWLDDLGIVAGTRLDIYQDEMNRLIICPPGITPNTDLASGEAKDMARAIQ